MKRRAGFVAESGQFADPEFSRQVIAWQRLHGRHGLAWQGTNDPYRIWLSEVMLQQTQVAAVVPYYLRFLERFPTVIALADADISAVMGLWSGLGYYSRARNLHRCAQQIRDEYGGMFPVAAATLATLPGIGRSTAAAIAAFAFGEPAAILDGNVKRVFCRVFGIDGYPAAKLVESQLWARAEALLPERDIGAYTQGLMDLGATVCTRSRPRCDACPLQMRCVARESGRVAELPARKPTKPLPERRTEMIVALCGDEVLLEQRGPSGIWGGLVSLPEVLHDGPEDQAREAVVQSARAFGRIGGADPLERVSHGFTHFRLHIRPWLVRVEQKQALCAESVTCDWYSTHALASAALPAPVRKLLERVMAARSDQPLPD